MTSMKDYYEEMMTSVEKEIQIDMTEEIESLMRNHYCIFCKSGEVLMCREVYHASIKEHLHCIQCGEDWRIIRNRKTGHLSKIYKAKTFWLDKFKP